MMGVSRIHGHGTLDHQDSCRQGRREGGERLGHSNSLAGHSLAVIGEATLTDKC